MARTDPPIKLKRSVLRRVVATKLEALRRGDFYVRNHLGPECYEPIVAEARSFLSINSNGDAPSLRVPQDPSPSLSEDLDTFVQIIAASILIDASMRGENAGESDPRFIKKKKKMLTKTLKGVKFEEFVGCIWRFDCVKRGVEVPPVEESEEEPPESESNSSDEASHDDSVDDTSVTSHTSGDGFSTSASSKRHHHGSGSSSKRKKHKKEKKKLRKEKKRQRKEERRRRKEEKRAKREREKKKHKTEKKKRKREDEESEDEYEEPLERKDDGPAEMQEEEEVEYEEIEHATKEEFESFRTEILSKIPGKVKKRFREGGFSKWGKDWLPILEIGPFDVEPGPVRRMWMEMFHNTRQNGREMTRLVFWYGVKFEDRGQAYSFVPSSKIISFEEGKQAGHCDMPKKIQQKIDKRVKLTKTEEQIMRGLREIKADMAKEKGERIQWMMHFQEDYEVAESMPDPEQEPEPEHDAGEDAVGEVKIKRKPGRPKKSETFDGEDKPIKRKPGRPKKSDSAAASGGNDAPIKRKPGRPKKSDAEKAAAKEAREREKLKAKSESKTKSKKYEIVDEDNDYQLDSDEDEDDQDYDGESSDDSSVDESEDADDELSEKASHKRKASDETGRPKKKSKLSEEKKEKKRREKAEALGLDYKPKTSKYAEEQKRFSKCEDVFVPLIQQLQAAKDDRNVKSVLDTIDKLIKKVDMLTPPFLRSYPLGMLVRDVRKSFESSEPEVKNRCKLLTNEMKRVYNEKDKNVPDEFEPVKQVEKWKHSESTKIKIESGNDDTVKTEDAVEPPTIRSNADAYPDQTLRSTEVTATDPVKTDPIKTDPVKTEPTKPLKKTFSIKGMFEKPKPIPKPKVTPAVIVSGPVSPKPKSLPSWVTGPPQKGEEDFHELHAKDRNFAIEFLTDAASSIPSDKVDPVSVSQALELAIFAETKLRGNDWNKYWEKVHDVVAMISPGKNQPNSIMVGIARGDYQDPSQLVTLKRREIHSLNQQRVKSLL